MMTHGNCICGSILIISFFWYGSLGHAFQVEPDVEDLATQIAFGDSVPLDKLSMEAKEALMAELLLRYEEIREQEEGRLHSVRYWRCVGALLRLGDVEVLARVMDDHRPPMPGLRREISRNLIDLPTAEQMVLLIDDYLFVEEVIDWHQYADPHVLRSMKTLPEIAAEQLDWFVVRHPTRRECFADEVREFINGMRGMYADERYGHPAPEEMVAAFRDFWKENREHFLESEYERVKLSENTREIWKTYQKAVEERYMSGESR